MSLNWEKTPSGWEAKCGRITATVGLARRTGRENVKTWYHARVTYPLAGFVPTKRLPPSDSPEKAMAKVEKFVASLGLGESS